MPNRRKSAASHRARGTLRPERHTDADGVQFEEGLPHQPDWLDDDAGEVWDALIEQLANAGILTRADVWALGTLAVLLAEFQKDPAGFANPRLAQMRALLSAFGLTPSDRGRPEKAPKADPDDVFWERFR